MHVVRAHEDGRHVHEAIRQTERRRLGVEPLAERAAG
jgi:hypothetical protein